MRVLLTGGGTAGHINPAIAIADIIRQNCPRADIAFVGTPHGMENRLVSQAGYPLFHVNVSGFSRSFSLKNIRSLWLACTSPFYARRILTNFQPDLVIGTGGYVSWPILRAAAQKHIPTALHESNALPGLTVRRLSPYMDALWLNFAETARALPKGSVVPKHTGNPMRKGFTTADREKARAELGIGEKQLLLLSFGGSLGAEALNKAMLAFMNTTLPTIPQLVCIHACGEKHYPLCRASFADTDQGKLLPYIDKMDIYMAAADIVVCRSGAMTLSELSLCGKCAILIPSPHVVQNHQYKNAEVLAQAEAALLLSEKSLPENKLDFLIKSLVFEKNARRKYENNIKKFAIPASNRIIWQEIQLLAQKRQADSI